MSDASEDILPELFNEEELASMLQQSSDGGEGSHSASLPTVSTACWGWLLTGRQTSHTPGFIPGRGHFKNHFCPQCRAWSHPWLDPTASVLHRPCSGPLPINSCRSPRWCKTESRLRRADGAIRTAEPH